MGLATALMTSLLPVSFCDHDLNTFPNMIGNKTYPKMWYKYVVAFSNSFVEETMDLRNIEGFHMIYFLKIASKKSKIFHDQQHVDYRISGAEGTNCSKEDEVPLNDINHGNASSETAITHDKNR